MGILYSLHGLHHVQCVYGVPAWLDLFINFILLSKQNSTVNTILL